MIQELINFSENKSRELRAKKAYATYSKLLRHNHHALAERVRLKYGNDFLHIRNDDAVAAFHISLVANSKRQKL